MILIEVSYNDDTISMTDNQGTINMKVKYPFEILKILEEVINILKGDEKGVQLVKIDEDSRTVIGEWE